MDEFLTQHWQSWSANNAYLGIGPHYNTECPPLMIMRGHNEVAARPLVGISLEPLLSWHFPQQQAQSGNLHGYMAWNLDYFNVFPALANAQPPNPPQAYWSNLYDFVAGWAHVPADVGFSWQVFARNYVELPLVPLHAPRHNHAAVTAALPALVPLLIERISLVRTEWPEAGFVLLGSIARRLLPIIAADPGQLVVPPPHTPESEELYGTRLWAPPMLSATLAPALGPPPSSLFYRTAPFAQGHIPRGPGRRCLGVALRALHDATLDGA